MAAEGDARGQEPRKISGLRRFWHDVWKDPAVKPLGALLVIGLIVLVSAFTELFSFDAVDRATDCDCSADPGLIPVTWGYMALVAVTVLAFVAGWHPIYERQAQQGHRWLPLATALGAAFVLCFVIAKFAPPGGFWFEFGRWGYMAMLAITVLWVAGPPVSRGLNNGFRRLLRGGRREHDPTELDPFTRILTWLRGLAIVVLKVLGRAASFTISLMDTVLARPVAIVAGTTVAEILPQGLKPYSAWFRYGIFLAWMAAAITLGWRSEVPDGLWYIGFGILLIFGVARRWSWVERDREAFLVMGKEDDDVVRVGFGEDLRDEALTALIFLFVLIPLGLRQLHMGFDAFDVPPGDAPEFFRWLGFFGAELVKSVPFVDWSEVFHVENGSPIAPKTALGAQFVFGLRVVLDLLLLAALVQALQIAGRLNTQDRAWDDGNLEILDPFRERRDFRQLESETFDDRYAQRAEQEPVVNFNGNRIDGVNQYRTSRLEDVARGRPVRGSARSPIMADHMARRAAFSLLASSAPDRIVSTVICEPEASSVLDMRGERNPAMARFAVRQAMETSPTFAVNRLLYVLERRDMSSAMAEATVRELGNWFASNPQEQSEGVVDLLINIIQDTDHRSSAVRAQAGLALARLGERSARPFLEKLAGRFRRNGDVTPALATAYALGLLLPEGSDATSRAQRAVNAFADERLHELAHFAARLALGKLGDMVKIPEGRFDMGSPEDDKQAYRDEKPLRPDVRIDAFMMGMTPVTFEEFDAFYEATGFHRPSDNGWGRDQRPVINVSWHDAHAYCDWLHLFTGMRFRLPTEAEWEYACRAGNQGPFFFSEDGASWEEDVKRLPQYAWFNQTAGQRTHPVAQLKPNDFGLYDMIGNVWEACADPRHSSYMDRPGDGRAWITGGNDRFRIVRGGCWLSDVRSMRSADRGLDTPDARDDLQGFRLALSF